MAELNRELCPNCKEIMTYMDSDIDVPKQEAWADFECMKCGYSEKRIYKYSNTEVINSGEKEDGENNRGKESN